jgi:putative spermidine/putrescine transport system permease protein
MLIALVLGTLAAVGLARTSFRGKDVLYAAILSPLIVPTIIIAIGLYFWLVPWHIAGSPVAIVVGHVVLGTPYVIVVVGAALERFDPVWERAALGLGATPAQLMWHVILPIIRPALLSAALLAYLASFDELIIALFLSGPQTLTLPIQMWRGIRFESDPTIAAVSTLLIVVSAVVLWAARASRARVPGTT